MARQPGLRKILPDEAMIIPKHRVVRNKLDYAKGKRPPVDCILCAVARNDPKVDNLVVFQRGGYLITLNLYPYNPGHLMIAPEKHYEDVREFSPGEVMEMHQLQVLTLDVLEKVYQPGGFNVGYNLGKWSGASISHVHLQIVPRYPSEIGFFDLFSDSRVIVEEPAVTKERLSRAFREAATGFFQEP